MSTMCMPSPPPMNRAAEMRCSSSKPVWKSTTPAPPPAEKKSMIISVTKMPTGTLNIASRQYVFAKASTITPPMPRCAAMLSEM
eukprot:2094476-Rhodomonas_salina.2